MINIMQNGCNYKPYVRQENAFHVDSEPAAAKVACLSQQNYLGGLSARICHESNKIDTTTHMPV